MTVFDNLLVDIVCTLFPFLVYFLYIAYKEIDDERETELAIILTIFSSMYMVLKYGNPMLPLMPMLIVNTPLLIAYLKKNNIAITMASIVIIFYYFNFYQGYLLILTMEYIIYYCIYLFCNKRISIDWYIIIFTILKVLFLSILATNMYQSNNALGHLLEVSFVGIIFGLVSIAVVYLIRKAEDILRIHKSAKEMEHDKQLRTTLFQITHEIKNPIAVCKGYLDMFDVNNPQHSKKYIPIMKEEIDTVLLLLEDYLSLNRVKLNKDILDISMLLEDTLDKYDMIFKNRKITTKVNLIDDEVYIDGDYNRLIQVFVNIIKNSIEALKENPLIEIWSQIIDKKIYIYFKDNGEGIPKDILEKIEEPFFTTKIKGTGLGVPLSKGIIEAHGGDIKYESDYGIYTLVTVSLPLANLK